MQQGAKGERQSPSSIPSENEQAGLYVYCVAPSGDEVSLEEIGIESHAVYSVVHEGISALVHDCLARPYESQDDGTVAAWVLAHHQVVETAWRRWGTVLPLIFNTIIWTGTGNSATQNVKAWLKAEHESLKGKMDAFRGKAEYGVQVSWDPKVICKQMADASQEIRKLEEEAHSKPRGLAYMYRQKMESLLKREMEARAAEEFKDLFRRLSLCADSVHLDKTKACTEGRQMLLNLSCLVSTESYPDFEAELGRVRNREGFFARLAGPLPPYSFC